MSGKARSGIPVPHLGPDPDRQPVGVAKRQRADPATPLTQGGKGPRHIRRKRVHRAKAGDDNPPHARDCEISRSTPATMLETV